MTLQDKIKKFPAYSMSRVTGWLVNKSAMGPGKQSEFKDRVYYDTKKSKKTNK